MNFDLEEYRKTPDLEKNMFVINWLGHEVGPLHEQLTENCLDVVEYSDIAKRLFFAMCYHIVFNAKTNRLTFETVMGTLKQCWDIPTEEEFMEKTNGE